jgi:hypothetical protein
MVGTVKPKPTFKSRALKKGGQAVLLPGPDEANAWESWLLGTGPHVEKVQVCATPGQNNLRQLSTLALPVRHVFCLPLWLNETNAKLFPGMIALQLELRGLHGRGKSPLMLDWSGVTRDGSRTLVMVGILPEVLPDDLQVESYRAFDVSARYFPFAPNSLTLWQEQERLAVAVTRGAELAYYRALSDDRLSSRVLQDLICIRGTLEMEGVVSDWREIVLWSPLTPSERSSLQTAFGLPIRDQDRPAPRLPKTPWSLMPAKVATAKKRKQSRRWQFRLILTGLVLYLTVALALLGRYLETSYSVNQLQKWQTEHAGALNLVHSTKAAWQNLQPALDEKSYPLEQLLQCAGAIPADDLHLTLFEQNGDKLLIKAEARNAAAAFQFADNLKKVPAFAGYSWDMSQPHLLPNDLAQIQIEGTRATSD